jgi:hypothetical protein
VSVHDGKFELVDDLPMSSRKKKAVSMRSRTLILNDREESSAIVLPIRSGDDCVVCGRRG